MTTRRGFIGAASAAVAAAGCYAVTGDGAAAAAPAVDPRDAFQREIDDVTPGVWSDYYSQGIQLGEEEGASVRAKLPALQRYEDAFDKVVREIRETTVSGRPAVWLVYNMGVIVKTAGSLFAIDLHHRRAEELAPMLDFALITHNHDDHYTRRFLDAMNRRERKTVVSNFCDNYGAHYGKKSVGGYTRAVKTFELGDVKVRTTYTDHNSYLVDFTTVFEVTAGDFVLYHSGDCSNAGKLKPVCANPDLWIFHPYCGMKAVDGARAVNPKLAAVAHLNELGHAKNRWRWTWAQGEAAKAKLEAEGFSAVVPLWGERIV